MTNPKRTTSLWHATSSHLAVHDAALKSAPLPGCHGNAIKVVDVCVIGAGISGTAIAYWIAKLPEQQKSKMMESVVVLESDVPGRGATGRNGGHSWPSPSEKDTVPLSVMRLAAFRQIQSAVKEHSIDCEYRVNGGVMLAHTAEEAAIEREWVAKLAADPQLAAFGLEWWDEARVRQLYPKLSMPCSGAVYEPHVASLHPIKLLDGLWRAIRELAGSRIQLHCNTTVHRVLPLGDDGLLRVETSRGTVRARKVIYATNAYTRLLVPHLFTSVMPYRGQIVTTCPQPDFPNQNFSCNERENNLDYMIKRVPTGELVYGGASDSSDHFGGEYGCLDDDSVNGGAARGLRREVRALLGADVEIIREWTGCMAFTPDERALVGELPRVPRVPTSRANAGAAPLPLRSTGSNEYVCVGHNGDGMSTVFSIAKELVHGIATGDWSTMPPELNCERYVKNNAK